MDGQIDGAGVVLSLESKEEGRLRAACEMLKGLLPEGDQITEHRDRDDQLNSPATQSSPGTSPSPSS